MEKGKVQFLPRDYWCTNATSGGFPCITNKDLKTGNCKKYFGLKKKKWAWRHKHL